ncbi:MAG: PA2169 family four-helix-bundle protein [Saprospiraceae bacterium]
MPNYFFLYSFEQILGLSFLVAKTKYRNTESLRAAENVQEVSLQNMFKANADQRYAFGKEIKDCIKNFGGTPDKGQSIEGQIHQVWMDIRAAFASKDDIAILKEINRGEEYALEAYDKALENLTIGTLAYDRIVAQRNQVRTIHSRTQTLEGVHSA